MGTPIESKLVGYILAVTYATFELIVKDSVDQRWHTAMDAQSLKFLTSAVKGRVRSIKIGELSGILGQFDDSYKEEFKRKVHRDKGQTVHYYDSILSNRHALAHGGTCNATIGDIELWLPLAKNVITAFQSALHI